jgi:retinol dehydrogenase 12
LPNKIIRGLRLNDYNEYYLSGKQGDTNTMATHLSMENKFVLVTGATNGIGKVTAAELAKMGAFVTIVGRSPEKTFQVVEELKTQTGNDHIDYLVADLSVQSEVHWVAEQFQANHDRLDVLVNNAGAVFLERQESADGIEMTLALNHLNYFMLTNLLLDLLKASAPARIVNVSSMAHQGARLDFNDLQMKKGYSGWSAYGRSKLMNLYFTYELARHLNGSGVTVNALHPGFVATNFGKSNGGMLGSLFSLFQVVAISPEKGAQTSIYLASSPELEGVTGKYFSNNKAISSSQISYNAESAAQLWDLSLEITGQKIVASA